MQWAAVLAAEDFFLSFGGVLHRLLVAEVGDRVELIVTRMRIFELGSGQFDRGQLARRDEVGNFSNGRGQ